MIDAVADPGHAALVGTRVGVAWIARACGACRFCQSGRENLCAQFLATGRDTDGGYAEYMLADAAYVHPIPDRLSDVEAAPLLCAGAIGWRSLALAGLTDGETLGLTGFGASAHLVIGGGKVLLCDKGEVVDIVLKGQGVLNVLAIGGVKDELDSQLVRLGDVAPSGEATAPSARAV